MSAPRPEAGWGYPRDISAHGHRIDELINVTALLVGILLAISLVWLLWACLAHGRSHRALADHGNAPRQALWA
jgi:hypothetical protein